jgi:hypothetical protein
MLPHLLPPRLPPAEVQHGDFGSLPPLHVITVISNPERSNARNQLYREFAHRTEAAGARLYTVELALGQRPFAVTESDNARHFRFRSDAELWHKENLINLGLARLPDDWKYVAWIDCDIAFNNPHWVNETIQQLQHFHIVQMFSWAQELDANFNPLANSLHRGFVYGWALDPGQAPIAGPQGTPSGRRPHPRPHPHPYPHPNPHPIGDLPVKIGEGGSLYHPGYAWAARRETIDGVGGLIDFAVMGQGDYHMAQCLVDNYEGALYPGIHPSYKERVQAWQTRAQKVVNRNVGYVDGLITHYWHGKKGDRRYWTRNRVLIDNDYNPNTDLIYDHRGVLQFAGNKPGLRDGLRNYFRARNEDSIDL